MKTTLIIKGNLIVSTIINGGGVTYLSSEEQLKQFDTTNAIVFEGDINLSLLDAKDKEILVLGSISVKGGGLCQS